MGLDDDFEIGMPACILSYLAQGCLQLRHCRSLEKHAPEPASEEARRGNLYVKIGLIVRPRKA